MLWRRDFRRKRPRCGKPSGVQDRNENRTRNIKEHIALEYRQETMTLVNLSLTPLKKRPISPGRERERQTEPWQHHRNQGRYLLLRYHIDLGKGVPSWQKT